MDSYKKDLNFAEPQSMNYDKKLNDIYEEWQTSILESDKPV